MIYLQAYTSLIAGICLFVFEDEKSFRIICMELDGTAQSNSRIEQFIQTVAKNYRE